MNSNKFIWTTDNTFMVDRMIFTMKYPEMKGDVLRVYLLMCRVVGFKKNGFFMGINLVEKEVNLSTHHVKKAINFLESNHFIENVGNLGRATKYKVLTVPLYDEITKTYYSRKNIARDRVAMKNSLNGYVELPVDIFSGSILRDHQLWSDRKIKTLMMLYSYHFVDVYGGVDLAAIQFNSNHIIVDDFVVNQMGFHVNDLRKSIQILIREDYAYKEKVIYRENPNSCLKERQYIGDSKMVVKKSSDDEKSIIRMKCIPRLKLEKAFNRTQGAINR